MEYLNDLLWGKVLVLILVTLGLIFTVVSRFVQFRYFRQMFGILKEAFQHQEGHLSSFQALAPTAVGRPITWREDWDKGGWRCCSQDC